MVDLTATQARDKGADPSANCEGDQIEGATAKYLNTLPPLSANGVDMMYHQWEVQSDEGWVSYWDPS
jgi:hypothetical protein